MKHGLRRIDLRFHDTHPTELVSVDQGLCTTPEISDVVQRPVSIEASSKGDKFAMFDDTFCLRYLDNAG